MSNGGSRVSIPNSIRKTIHDIKEIAAKHSDEDIYAMLKECKMDPNETAQRLLYLDTFQEVKKKRDIRKMNVNNRVSEESRWRTGTQGRGFRGGRGHYSSSHNYHVAGGGRNVNAPKENGINNCMERGFNPLPTVPEKTEKNMNSHVTISNISVNGPASIPNGTSGHECAPKPSADVHLCASDPAVVPLLDSPNPVVGASEHEVSSYRNASKCGATFPALSGSIAIYTIGNSIQETSGDVNNAVLKEFSSVGKNKPLEQSQPSQLVGLSEGFQAVVAAATVAVDGGYEPLSEQNTSVLEDAISKLGTKRGKLNYSGHQVVIFPDHLQVPEDIRNGLTFGSLDFEQSVNLGNDADDCNDSLPVPGLLQETGKAANDFEQSVNLGNDPDDSNDSLPAPEFLQETGKAAKETSLSNLNLSSTAREGDYLNNPHSLPHVPDSKAHLEDNISSDAAPKYDQSIQDIVFSQGGPQYPFVHMSPNYGIPFVQPLAGSQLAQCERAGPQSGNSVVSSTSATSQTASQPADVGQSSIAISPPPFPVFRQPYSPYYFPFAPYFPSFYMAPNAQFLGPSGLPQQTSTGNIFLSPPAAVPGSKFSVPPGKSGINAGNLPQFGVPSGYSSYSPSPTVTFGNSACEETAASGLKENGVYSTVQQGERPLFWLPAPGRDILHANSFYNHLPQGQHVTFPPPPPPGIYHPTKTMSATSTANPLL